MALTDVLVIGGSLSSFRCASEIATRGIDVVHLSGAPAERASDPAHTSALWPPPQRSESVSDWFETLVWESDWGADQSVVRRLVDALAQTSTTSDPVVSADSAPPPRDLWSASEPLELLGDSTRCWGAVIRIQKSGEIRAVLAKATVIADGGSIDLYGPATRRARPGGRGVALAMAFGAPIANPEAVQFHPIALVPNLVPLDDTYRLDGGKILDAHHNRFLVDLEPVHRECAPRDVVARHMSRHLHNGHGAPSRFGSHLWLDVRRSSGIAKASRAKRLRHLCRSLLGLDPSRELIPVRPAPHYLMGGIRTNADGQAYGIRGLFAIGEAACWDLHGFNRRGGMAGATALAEGWIVGKRVAEYAERECLNAEFQLAVEAIRRHEAQLRACLEAGRIGPSCAEIYDTIAATMRRDVGVIRHGQALERAVARLRTQLDLVEHATLPMGTRWGSRALAFGDRLRGLARLAYLTAFGALQRRESRGAHFRSDHPSRDDADWLVRTMARWPSERADPTFDYEPVGRIDLAPAHRCASSAPAIAMKVSTAEYNAGVLEAQLRVGKPLDESELLELAHEEGVSR